jgi:hypothetical protein
MIQADRIDHRYSDPHDGDPKFRLRGSLRNLLGW